MINWPAIIRQLERKRLRHIDIASAVGRSERWVGLVKQRAIRQPTYDQGVLLIELAVRYGIEVARETQDVSVRFSRIV